MSAPQYFQSSFAYQLTIRTFPGRRIANEIAKNGPIGIKAAKEAIDVGIEAATALEALDVERRCYSKVLPTKDRLEGLAAFKEGRTPQYSGQ